MRTIYKVIPSEHGKTIVQSNDGKLYVLCCENGGFWWDELPGLPQDGVKWREYVEVTFTQDSTVTPEEPRIYYDGKEL